MLFDVLERGNLLGQSSDLLQRALHDRGVVGAQAELDRVRRCPRLHLPRAAELHGVNLHALPKLLRPLHVALAGVVAGPQVVRAHRVQRTELFEPVSYLQTRWRVAPAFDDAEREQRAAT